jgi:glycosyltransferase involved in cell wall biosynthesis
VNRSRVVHIIPTLDQGGAENQLALLAAGLPSDEFDVHVVLLTRDGPRRAQLESAKIPITTIGKRMKADPTAYFRLVKAIKELQPDLVQTWLFAANSYGRMAARQCGVKRIIASERCVDLWKTGRHLLVDRLLARFTDRIATNSSGVRDYYAMRGIDASKFVIIPNGVSPLPIGLDANASGELLDASRQRIAQSLGLDPRRRWIAAVGRLWPQKNYKDLIWGAQLLTTIEEDVTLIIVGDGPQSRWLEQHRDQVTGQDRVIFAGHRSDVREILQHCLMYWIGSSYEGQSNGVMEAMQLGLPVIASDIPGNRDLVVDGVTGLLFPVGHSMSLAKHSYRLLSDPALRAQFGAAAKERIAQQFSLATMVDSYAQLYRELLGR